MLANRPTLFVASFGLMCLAWLAACHEDRAKPAQVTQHLIVPEQATSVYITDQVTMAGQTISLWFEHGRCQLQISHPKLKLAPVWLQPSAPCYFMKSPGTDTVQVYQRDKTNRVLAVIGTPLVQTPAVKRCGTEIQGIVLNAVGTVSLSNTLHRGSLFCADQGLGNAQYELLAQD